jgi:hypothetical protein
MMAEITAREASARFNLSIGHLARLARAGEIEGARHFGPMWVFDEDKLVAWVNDKSKHRIGGKREGAGRPKKQSKTEGSPDA